MPDCDCGSRAWYRRGGICAQDIEVEEPVAVERPWASAVVKPDGSIWNLRVHVDHRRQGHGTALMRYICEQFGERDLSLWCSPDLVEWYRSFGFEVEREAKYEGWPEALVRMERKEERLRTDTAST